MVTNILLFCWLYAFFFFRITGIEKLNNVDTIKTFFPFAYNQYWFMTAYLYLMVLTPFINKLLNVLKQQDYKKNDCGINNIFGYNSNYFLY